MENINLFEGSIKDLEKCCGLILQDIFKHNRYEFEIFLKKEGVFEKFIHEIDKQIEANELTGVQRSFHNGLFGSNKSLQYYITYAIIWSKTKDGRSFWGPVSSKWERMCYNMELL